MGIVPHLQKWTKLGIGDVQELAKMSQLQDTTEHVYGCDSSDAHKDPLSHHSFHLEGKETKTQRVSNSFAVTRWANDKASVPGF